MSIYKFLYLARGYIVIDTQNDHIIVFAELLVDNFNLWNLPIVYPSP